MEYETMTGPVVEPKSIGVKVYANIPCCTHKEAGWFVRADILNSDYVWISIDTGLRYTWKELSQDTESMQIKYRDTVWTML